MHAFDGQTDRQRQTDRQTDGQTEFSSLDRVCILCSAVKIRQCCRELQLKTSGVFFETHCIVLHRHSSQLTSIDYIKTYHSRTTLNYTLIEELAVCHSLKMIKHRCKSEVRHHFFSERVVNRWNMLDQDTISVKTLNGFKTKLEKERSRWACF